MSRVNLSILAIFLIALFAISSQAADMTIMVGKGNTLTFDPQNGTVSKGDVITFMFVGGTHSVLLADTAATKCNLSTKIANPKIAGPTAAGGKATYTVTGDIAKIWYYCGVPGHCDKGMWGLLSLSTGTSSNSTSTGAAATSTDASNPSPTGDATMSMPMGTMSMTMSMSMTGSMTGSTPGSTAPSSSGAGRVEFSTAAVVGGFILYVAAQLL